MENTRRRMPLEFFVWDDEDESNASPIVRINIGGKQYKFLVDTGASMSLLDKDTVTSNKLLKKLLKPSDRLTDDIQTMNGVMGAPKKMLTISNLIISRSKPLTHTFYMLDLQIEGGIYHGVLGFDFLMMHKVILDFDKLIATFSDNS